MLDSAVRIFKATLLKVLPFSVLATVAGQLQNIYIILSGRNIRPFSNSDPGWWAVYLLGTIVGAALINAIIVRQGAIATGSESASMTALKEGLRNVPAVVLMGIVMAVLVGIWFVPLAVIPAAYRSLSGALLAVPAFYLLVLFLCSWPARLVDRKGPIESLRYSAHLVRGNWWRTVMVYLVVLTIHRAIGDSRFDCRRADTISSRARSGRKHGCFGGDGGCLRGGVRAVCLVHVAGALRRPAVTQGRRRPGATNCRRAGRLKNESLVLQRDVCGGAGGWDVGGAGCWLSGRWPSGGRTAAGVSFRGGTCVDGTAGADLPAWAAPTAPHAPVGDAMANIDACVARLDLQLDIGYDRIAARCPDLMRQLEAGAWAPWLPRGWKESGNDLSAGSLKELRELVARESNARESSLAKVPDVRSLQPILATLAGNRDETGWSRFKSWLRSILEAPRATN